MKMIASLIAVTSLVFAGQLYAAEPQSGGPAVSKKKILVVYYSRSGNTKKVAQDIAKAIGADIDQLIDKKDRSGAGGYVGAGKDATMGKLTELEPVKYDPAQYDLVVLGTPVWAWTMTPALRTYITDHKAAIKQMAVFTTAGGTRAEKVVPKIEELAGQKAVAFAGIFERELKEKNLAVYEKKLGDFVAQLR